MNLKCKLAIEWDEGYMNDTIEAYRDDGYSYDEAKDRVEDWIRQEQVGKIEWILANTVPNYTFELSFDWRNE